MIDYQRNPNHVVWEHDLQINLGRWAFILQWKPSRPQLRRIADGFAQPRGWATCRFVRVR